MTAAPSTTPADVGGVADNADPGRAEQIDVVRFEPMALESHMRADHGYVGSIATRGPGAMTPRELHDQDHASGTHICVAHGHP